MPDIFLSYNREDSARAKLFADAFAAQGFSVWWDVGLKTGEAYDKVTEDALRGAKAVVVLWSKKSVESRWVRAEATLADRNRTLVPCMIEPCERPIMFELTQTAELSTWSGNPADRSWTAFLDDVRRFVGREAAPAVPARAGSPLPSLDQRSIAVLPFTNMGKDEEQEYFADGITEDVINDLGKVSALSVIARNTAFAFKDQMVDVQKVARQLNVTHVLEGSVRRAGERVRVNVQLIDGSTGSQVWSERWDRKLDDIFELQDELSQAIVGALKVRLLPKEKEAIAERGTTNFEAYDLFMKARARANSARVLEDHLEGIALFQKVLEIDPGFTPALGGVAQNAMLAAIFGGDHAEIVGELDRLQEAAKLRAGDVPGAQVLRGTWLAFQFEWSAALAALESAMSDSPAFVTEVAHVYASQLLNVGRVREAFDVLAAAMRTDPLSPVLIVPSQVAHLIAGRPDDARSLYDRNVSHAGFREDFQHIELWRLWPEGDKAAIRAQITRYLSVQSLKVAGMEDALAIFDQPDVALALLRKAAENPANQYGTQQVLIACHLATDGDIDVAATTLRRGVVHYNFPAKYLMWLPFFKQVRQTATFKQTMRELKLPQYWRESGNWGDFARPVGEDDFEIIA